MRRGQVATEYLLTYGWAILAVLVVMGVLAFFGATRPAGFVPEKCLLSAGFTCVDYRLEQHDGSPGSEVVFRILNNKGVSVRLYQVNISCTGGCRSAMGDSQCGLFAEGGMDTGPFVSETTVQSGQAVWVSCNPDDQASILFEGPGARAKIYLEFQYGDSDGSVTHRAGGEMISRVEKR